MTDLTDGLRESAGLIIRITLKATCVRLYFQIRSSPPLVDASECALAKDSAILSRARMQSH